MSYSVDQLKGLVSRKQGIARTNTYRVILPSIGGVSGDEVNLLCKNVTLPGKQFVTQERIMGTHRQKIVNGYAVDDVSMTFVVLNDVGIKRYFENWAALSFDNNSYEINYKTSYAKQIKIQMLRKGISFPIYSTSLGLPRIPPEIANRLPKIGPFDLAQGQFDLDFIADGDIIYECILEDAFPTTINSIQLSDELDGLAELNIQMSYTNWKDTRAVTEPSSNLGNIIASTLINKIVDRIF